MSSSDLNLFSPESGTRSRFEAHLVDSDISNIENHRRVTPGPPQVTNAVSHSRALIMVIVN